MQHHWMLGLCGLAASATVTLGVWAQDGKQNQPRSTERPVIDAGQAQAQFRATHPGSEFHELGGRIGRVYGTAFGGGDSPHQAAESFIQRSAAIWGIQPSDLIPVGPFEDERHLQPIMYENGQPKFTGVYYTQVRDGVEVFRSRLTLLARNEQNYPLVLASADLRDIGAFQVNAALVGKMNPGLQQSARNRFGEGVEVIPQGQVIWAGIDDLAAAPRLADESLVIGGDNKWLLLTATDTAEVLYDESLICFGSVSGSAAGNATPGIGADICADEVPMVMPYLRITSGAVTVFTDVDGNFVINPGGPTITATPSGMWFNVTSVNGALETLTIPTDPPANLLFNALNNSQNVRAQTNTYVEANRIRDYTLAYNPAYPALQDPNMTVRVNRTDLYCPGNAWYDSSDQSINFCLSGPSNPNTSWSSVVYHEYGHRLVNAAGSGQGPYGEGSGDVMSVLLLDHPCIGLGFFNSCTGCLRSADNNCQYLTSGCSTCGDQNHSCGQLLSGCVWDLRNELAITNPATYRDILSNLAINAMLVHSGTTITPQITIDYLTLDDNDGDIGNGTPHRPEIAAAFAAHAMPAPPLAELVFAYPNGRPATISPSGGTLVRVDIDPGAGVLNPASPRLNVNTGGGFVPIVMTQVDGNTFDGTFPASTCGANVAYYISATTMAAANATSPTGAPANSFSTLSASSVTDAFSDNFQTDLGWIVTNDAALTDGAWDRGVPITNCDRGNPIVDGDGSGACYLTDNSSAGACNSDVDGGTTTLTSPTMDATGSLVYLTYWRWYDNTAGGSPNADTFGVQISSNNGTSWQTLETVGPGGPQAGGGWFQRQYNVGTIAGFTQTNQFRIRFQASDLGAGSVIEAAVDGVKLQRLTCSASVPGDIDGDGDVDIDDLLALISAWGACPAPPAGCPEDVVPNGQVDIDDLLFVISHWG